MIEFRTSLLFCSSLEACSVVLRLQDRRAPDAYGRLLNEAADVDPATERNLKALVGHVVVRVDTLDDRVEFDVGDSEGWRLVMSAAADELGASVLAAEWKPGLRRFRASAWWERMVARLRRAYGRRRHAALGAG